MPNTLVIPNVQTIQASDTQEIPLHVSYRTRSQGFRADNLTMYSVNNIFSEAFSLPSFHKHVYGEYEVDLDSVYDKCELERLPFEKTIETMGFKLFAKSKPYVKNRIIYKYFHDLGLDIISLVNTLYETIKYLITIDDIAFESNVKEKFGKGTSDIVKDRYIALLDDYADLFNSNIDYFDTPLFRQLRIIDDFLIGHKEIMPLLKSNLTNNFNNVIRNEYNIKVLRGNRALDNFTELSKLRANIPENSFGGSKYISSSFNNFSRGLTDNYIINTTNSINEISSTCYNPYNSLRTIGTVSTTSQLITYLPQTTGATGATQSLIQYTDPLTDLENSLLREFYVPRKPKQKVLKPKLNKKSPGVKIFNKSLKSIRKFIPKYDLDLFLKGGEFIFKAERFNYGFKLYSKSDLIEYSKNMGSWSIKWSLSIYDKETEQRLAKACIVFRDCPILDNVLSVYMMLKSGQEDEVLLNSGFHNTGPLYHEKLSPVVAALKKANDPKIGNRLDSNFIANRIRVGAERDLNTLIDNLEMPLIENPDNDADGIDTYTLDGHNRYENSRRIAYLERVSIEVEIKSAIRNWLERYLINNGMDEDLYKYTTNLDVSWGEAVDYEAFQLFDVKVFDKWVKPLKWSVKSILNTEQKIGIELSQ